MRTENERYCRHFRMRLERIIGPVAGYGIGTWLSLNDVSLGLFLSYVGLVLFILLGLLSAFRILEGPPK